MPTEGMREEAQRYRDWKADGEAGGTEVAARRATQILSGDELSPEVVLAMSAWHARHSVDAEAEGYKPGEDGYPSPGRVAAAAWGGSAGQVWSTAKADRIKEIRDRSMDTNRAEPDELSVGDFVQWRSSGGQAKGKVDRIERDGSINVPDSEFTINGDEDDPAALITVYREGDEGWEETDVQVGHRFSALTKIAALRWLEGKTYKRSEDTAFDEVEDRTYDFPFSSEQPVARYFGNEILSHEKGAADLSRLNDGAPLLFNHNPDRVIGVVERAYIDDDKRRGYARVRFSRNEFAQEVLRDVRDGIIRNVSFATPSTRWKREVVANLSLLHGPLRRSQPLRFLRIKPWVSAVLFRSPNPNPLPRQQYPHHLFLKWKTPLLTWKWCGPRPLRLSVPASLK